MKRILFPAIRLLVLLALAGFIPAGLAQSLPYNITNVAEQRAEGEALVQELLAQKPTASFTQTGTLKIRDGNGQRTSVPVIFSVSLTASNWHTSYSTVPSVNPGGHLVIVHAPEGRNQYQCSHGDRPGELADLASGQLMSPFAGSDFSFADLGLEFFHWPEQRLIRKEITRTRSCRVLESTNPQPGTGGYSKVRTWIDRETAGIVFAEAYDAKGKLLKEFSPKGVKQVNGQWRLQEMEMRNVQTRSRSLIVFDPATGQ